MVKEPPYDVGDDVETTLTFADAAGTLTNPSGGELEYVCPDGETITVDLSDMTHPSTGVYKDVYTVANGWGLYRLTARGTGAFAVVDQSSFRVRKPAS